MSAARIVEAVDVFENGDFDLPAGLPISAPNHFRLDGFEEALNCGVVMTVALAAHGCCQTMFSQDLLIVMGTVLAAAIRVMKTAFWWPAQRNDHVQGTDREVFFIRLLMAQPITRRECRSMMTAR